LLSFEAMENVVKNYLLDQKVVMFQDIKAYRTSSDAVLLSAMVDNIKDGAKILDIGSGVGGVSLCLAYRFSKAHITGFEIQPDLVALANKNAKENGFENLTYITHDIRQKKAPLDFCSVDVVVTNPPYGVSGTKSPNKSKATAHNIEDFSLEKWLKFCLKMLKPFGTLYLIHRAEALDEILSVLYAKAGDINVLPIFSKEGQNAKRVIIKAQKDSKAPLKILPPLIVHNSDGHTKAAEAILRDGKSYFDAMV